MSNVTPPGPAAALRLTVNENVVVPVFPSFWDTSLTDNSRATTPHGAGVVDVFRGFGLPAAKSAKLSSVSEQRLVRLADCVFERPGARSAPSKQSVVLP